MAIKYFCDRCNTEVGGPEYLHNVKLHTNEDDNGLYYKDKVNISKEVCVRCAHQIRDVINQKFDNCKAG